MYKFLGIYELPKLKQDMKVVYNPISANKIEDFKSNNTSYVLRDSFTKMPILIKTLNEVEGAAKFPKSFQETSITLISK